ncbi:hypothetical protein GCM10007421_18960 [Halopseudomonas oceani]|uniref:Uncharacterized protein n=1 Tax=Halopseudomonas oceani TaxID=1708783 RepID=A0A2P4EVP6_9GAMM|nr:hypothetical protein [Halopseudomonas oceani]POB03636.1 hypothetical protein C1949_09710 [Halopseudomonas oceani]GGE44992.1 hypothetical protein GCM10007421_18960 [Halopseudomonas oceani]
MADNVLLPLMLVLHMLSSLWASARPLPEQATRTQQRAWLMLKALPLAVATAVLLLSQSLTTALLAFVIVLVSQLILEHQRITRPPRFATSLLLGQILPIAVLVLLWSGATGRWDALVESASALLQPDVLIILLAALFLLHPTSTLIALILTPWLNHNDLQDERSLKQAGRLIGFLERMLIFAFVVMGQWSAIGFLLAAKSIMRFNDTRQAKRPVSEYVLLGTLLSFGFSIAAGLATRVLITS